jgi:hypothetical protein
VQVSRASGRSGPLDRDLWDPGRWGPVGTHVSQGVFEVSLEGLGASAQDIEALRRLRVLITGKSVAAQQE